MVLGIVGLGLIGGSLGLAARSAGHFEMLLGSDHNPEHARIALKRGIVDEIVSWETLKSRCDIIVLAVPVGAIIALLKELEGIGPETTVIDMGSTKTTIAQAVPPAFRSRFVAAHPMAGTEFAGPQAALATLYRDKVAVLCDLEASAPLQRSRARMLFESIGMRIVTMDAKAHDRHAAFISHLPHVISYSLANSVLGQEDKASILTLAAGGFRDMSRLAKSPAVLWRDIFHHNQSALLDAIAVFEKELSQAKSLIQNGEWEALTQFMECANTLHELFDPR